jgi:hypothetical protein
MDVNYTQLGLGGKESEGLKKQGHGKVEMRASLIRTNNVYTHDNQFCVLCILRIHEY